MKSILSHSMLLVMAVNALVHLASAEEQPVVHDPAIHTGTGLKKELIAGITEADFLKLGDKPKMVKITLVTAFTEANSWLNFNGYSHGKAVYNIPTGWTVEVTFINPSPAPHSAIVVEREMLRKVQVGEPAFKGASTPNPVLGMSTSKAIFTFTADEPGEYAIACGIPTHAMAGHWVALNVSAGAKVPTLKLGDGPPKEAK
jgi:plastocyanin